MLILTAPSSVNLIALLTRLERICLKRRASTNTSQLMLESISKISFRRFCRASPSNTRATDSTSSRKLARLGDKLRRPDSMRAMSRMSPISSSRLFAEV
ncbi:hypothetical protein D3C79_944340 [compost metagenome]